MTQGSQKAHSEAQSLVMFVSEPELSYESILNLNAMRCDASVPLKQGGFERLSLKGVEWCVTSENRSRS